jgi:hypothetical protein
LLETWASVCAVWSDSADEIAERLFSLLGISLGKLLRASRKDTLAAAAELVASGLGVISQGSVTGAGSMMVGRADILFRGRVRFLLRELR